MDKYNGEQVLVIPRAVLGVGELPQGFVPYSAEWAEKLHGVSRLELRADMEEDPTFKQIIPYVVYCRVGERTDSAGPGVEFLSYIRGGGGAESRLHAKMSYGIGGHMNSVEYGEELRREQAEEVEIYDVWVGDRIEPREIASFPIVGFVNDDSVDVGKVHLGVVHLVRLDRDVVARVPHNEKKSLSELAFRSPEEMRAFTLEGWTALTLDAMIKLAKYDS